MLGEEFSMLSQMSEQSPPMQIETKEDSYLNFGGLSLVN